MDVLINSIWEIISQCIRAPNHHIAYFKPLTILSIIFNKAEKKKDYFLNCAALILNTAPPHTESGCSCCCAAFVPSDSCNVFTKAQRTTALSPFSPAY